MRFTHNKLIGGGGVFQREEILVTGAGGFIGSHLVERLVREGANVRAFVHYNSRGDPGLLRLLDSTTLAQIEIISGDLRDVECVRSAVQGCGIVFHLGALIAIPYSYVNPRDVVQTNVVGTLNVLIAARELSVKRIVHTSTSEVYGTAVRVPMDEHHPLNAQSPYAASKVAADKLAMSFYLSFGLPVSIIRPFNTYGPRQSARAIIPTVVTQLLKSDRVRIGNLAPTRDFTHISDTINGLIMIAGSEGSIGEEINIGSGLEISIGDLVNRIGQLMGKKPRIKHEEARFRPSSSEVFRLVCDNRKAKDLLGWEPIITLDEGLELTIQWIRHNLSLYDRWEMYHF